jgi:hypothetical protein
MIELTIKLSTEKVEAAVREAWQREFRVPSGYHDAAGAGWQEVMRQVKAHIETLDISAAIAAAARARIDDVVNEAVTVALREKAKQRAKEMMRDGTLI